MKELVLTTALLGLLVAMVYWYLQLRRKSALPLVPSPRTLAGVRGWLLILCIILVFLYPLSLSRGINFRAVEEIRAAYPRAMTIALLDSFVVVALTVYSIYTGVRLWRVRPGAVTGARRFLVIIWVYFLLERLSIFAVGFPADVNLKLFRRLLWQLPVFSGMVLIWWLYLSRSKRVAATYRTGGT